MNSESMVDKSEGDMQMEIQRGRENDQCYFCVYVIRVSGPVARTCASTDRSTPILTEPRS
jgi:hypothetical protein